MQQACKGISPDPRSFNKCLAANNNAGLAFDMTYTKYYPLMYDLFMAYRPDLKATIDALKQALNTRSESEALRRLRNLAPHFVSSITYSGPPHPVPQRGTTLCPSLDGQRALNLNQLAPLHWGEGPGVRGLSDHRVCGREATLECVKGLFQGDSGFVQGPSVSTLCFQ
jgi:hypothetical protein